MLLLTVFAVVGCGSNGSNKGADSAETELTVLLDWYPNAVHTFLYAAEEQGYFKEAGLKVKLQTPADTNDALKLVATGKADLALSYQMQVAISRAEGIPIVSVGAIVRHPLNQLLVLDSQAIHSPKDLIGKKIGYPSIPLDEAIVNTMVKTDGGDPSKLDYVDVGWDLIPAMSTKKVDAIIGGYVNHEKLLLEKEGEKLIALDPSKYGVPDYYELVLTASEDGLKKNGAAIKKFMEAAARGQAYTASHPDEALQLLLDQQNKEFPLDADIEKQSLAILLPLMDAGTEPFGSQSEQSWRSIIDWLKEQGQLTKDVDPAEAFRNL
ncbi:ABC transporter substrate-binding protein [Paenibacillus sacheonensis]|uniref:ABC transporter substrate-binding protein n=1 Tax=Paenibacillus sacheonensis TaxID=742054 RepID=A0A7X5C0Q3_9BACL|nr:ABC transporter substrate-binding protein [Paenibacillus sacheonensis]MBM7568181.1 putative hydroxymethylpyrimidine transport system substrate-binding protein [Paenibacillus sacheonensis]NBC71821.1 ABC transporter substrate-binding protein [Paenibacillus sacheonensis]